MFKTNLQLLAGGFHKKIKTVFVDNWQKPAICTMNYAIKPNLNLGRLLLTLILCRI